MIWAAEGAQFGLVERVVGLTPFGGGVQRMAERAGPARAREFVMTGGLYDAEKMLEWGVVNRVLAPDELLEKGMSFARRLAAGPTLAHGATKRLVRAYLDGGVAAADATPRHRRAVVRLRGPQERGPELPRRRPRKGHFQGEIERAWLLPSRGVYG